MKFELYFQFNEKYVYLKSVVVYLICFEDF